jgi:hypothetical protein
MSPVSGDKNSVNQDVVFEDANVSIQLMSPVSGDKNSVNQDVVFEDANVSIQLMSQVSGDKLAFVFPVKYKAFPFN